MNILILGGSYFLGKCFVNMARIEHRITVFNRGNRPLNLPQYYEMRGDRHDTEAIPAKTDHHFEATVDF